MRRPAGDLVEDFVSEPRTSGYVDVNGVHMYYEVYGEGSPLVLLHGGIMTIELNFASLIPPIATRHTVIAVEMQQETRRKIVVCERGESNAQAFALMLVHRQRPNRLMIRGIRAFLPSTKRSTSNG